MNTEGSSSREPRPGGGGAPGRRCRQPAAARGLAAWAATRPTLHALAALAALAGTSLAGCGGPGEKASDPAASAAVQAQAQARATLQVQARLEAHARGEVEKSSATVRADRRLFDGAPPVIPHQPFGAPCVSCHNERGLEVAGVGFAPALPHERTGGMSATSRCEQCHVFRWTDDVLVRNGFDGLRQDLRRGHRLDDHSPPTLPHAVFMHENCLACHSGPGAREEIRCDHPERERCTQCHAPVTVSETFRR